MIKLRFINDDENNQLKFSWNKHLIFFVSFIRFQSHQLELFILVKNTTKVLLHFNHSNKQHLNQHLFIYLIQRNFIEIRQRSL
jgi:hypothetical protein